jgi:VanZ family protein
MRHDLASSPDTGHFMQYWLPVFIYACLIFYLSSLSHPEEYAPPLLRQLGDKMAHAVEYGVLGILFYRALRYAGGEWAGRNAVWLAVATSACYGLTDEIHQAFVPMREPDVLDLLMDGMGASIATCGWRMTVEPWLPARTQAGP